MKIIFKNQDLHSHLLNFGALNQEKKYFINMILQAILFIRDRWTHFLKLLKNQCMWYGGNKKLMFLLLNQEKN